MKSIGGVQMKSEFKAKLKKGLLVLGILASLSCAKKDKDVDFEVIPDRPVVIDSSITVKDKITGEKKTYNPPWYTFSIKLTNKSSKKITFVSMKAVVTGFINGETVTKDYNFDPGADSAGASWYYAVLDAVDATGKPGTYTSSGWIMAELPKVDGYVYSISLELIGWYGDYNTPEQRFSATFYHSTQ
jgi:hypothetical protein